MKIMLLIVLIGLSLGQIKGTDTPTPTPTPDIPTPTPTPTPVTPTPTPTPTPQPTPTPTPTPSPQPTPTPTPAPTNTGDYLFRAIVGSGPVTQTREFFSLDIMGEQVVAIGGVSDVGLDAPVPANTTLSFNLTTLEWKTGIIYPIQGQCSLKAFNTFYLFGGLVNASNNGTDAVLRYYNYTDGKIRVNSTAAPQGHSTGSSCTVRNQTIWIFGGAQPNADNCSNALAAWNRKTGVWSAPVIKGEKMPGPRTGSSLIQFTDSRRDDWLVLFGGDCFGRVSTNDVWWYNIKNSTWTPHPSTGPHTTSQSVVKTESNIALLFGGINLTTNLLSNEVWFYNLTDKTWEHIPTLNDTNKPTPRYGHGVAYSRRRMIIYGGRTEPPNDPPTKIYQFVLEKDCKNLNRSCGECILGGCGWCGDVPKSKFTPSCVAGDSTLGPYIENSCPHVNFTVNPVSCRVDHAPSWLVPVLVVILLVIFALVVATYVIDYKKSNAPRRGFMEIN